MANGKSYCILISFSYLTSNTMEYSNSAAKKNFKNYTISDVFLTRFVRQRLISIFYLNIHKQYVGSKLFHNKKTSIKWKSETLKQNDLL
jgi:hypothetical protein